MAINDFQKSGDTLEVLGCELEREGILQINKVTHQLLSPKTHIRVNSRNALRVWENGFPDISS